MAVACHETWAKAIAWMTFNIYHQLATGSSVFNKLKSTKPPRLSISAP